MSPFRIQRYEESIRAVADAYVAWLNRPKFPGPSSDPDTFEMHVSMSHDRITHVQILAALVDADCNDPVLLTYAAKGILDGIKELQATNPNEDYS